MPTRWWICAGKRLRGGRGAGARRGHRLPENLHLVDVGAAARQQRHFLQAARRARRLLRSWTLLPANNRPLHGHLLVAKAADPPRSPQAPLRAPRDYELVWAFHASCDAGASSCSGYGRSDAYFWLPVPPEGYRALGFLVTSEPLKPPLEEVGCVRADLTDECEPHGSLLHLQLARPPPSSAAASRGEAFVVRGVRPLHRGDVGEGHRRRDILLRCGRELPARAGPCVPEERRARPLGDADPGAGSHRDPPLRPHAILPPERGLPAVVRLMVLQERSRSVQERRRRRRRGGRRRRVQPPGRRCNDGEYWIDLPDGKRGQAVCRGDIDSAELYAHVQPAMGGACTDVAMWVFCPFNGPARLKLSLLNVPLGKTGQHVGDWEHYTLRLSNFTGELMAVYFSQHSGGRWVDASALEYTAGSRSVVYSSRNGHASYPYPGLYLQGSAALGIGTRNDAARSKLSVDSSVKYRIVAAEYLGDGVVAEPQWLQFMRESRKRMERTVRRLPRQLRCPAANILNKMPNELSKEEGPTGPKEKNHWEETKDGRHERKCVA